MSDLRRFNCMISYLDCAYQKEFDGVDSKICHDRDDNIGRNICDGTKNNCLAKGKQLCNKNPDCYGVMWNDQFGSEYKGVRLCLDSKLIFDQDNDWETYSKHCNEGKKFDSKNDL